MKRALVYVLAFVALVGTGNSTEYPRLVGEGVISTADDEWAITIAPDGRELYFVKAAPRSYDIQVILVSQKTKRGWSRPKVAPFSGVYRDIDPMFSPDGEKLVFASNRPLSHGGERRKDFELWMVERQPDRSWSKPRHLAELSSSGSETNSSIAADGTLYFAASGRADGGAKRDLYRARFVDGAYASPELLPSIINTADDESNHFIAPDQSYLLFCSSPRSIGQTDLRISFYKDGRWSAPRSLPEPINGGSGPFTPFVSADGRTLYYAARRTRPARSSRKPMNYEELETMLRSPGNGQGDLYQVPFDADRFR